MVLELIRDNQMLKRFPTLNDDYIEKMAKFYTSETAKVLFPNIDKIPFEDWIYRQYFLKFESENDLEL